MYGSVIKVQISNACQVACFEIKLQRKAPVPAV
jgi:hypothetical protein